jgi:hypothetical protein
MAQPMEFRLVGRSDVQIDCDNLLSHGGHGGHAGDVIKR